MKNPSKARGKVIKATEKKMKKVALGQGVTPHVSKPHDYVNHMFMRL
jgi:hypothetical protein